MDLRAEQHHGPAYQTLNPQGRVPALEVDGRVLTRSPAITEWLEDRFPAPPLLPTGFDALEALLVTDTKRGAFCF